ncbi:MAG: ABC transporter ATP-binding protein [Anaerolineaceae bacterium]|nr:ABC transporter ATP-binding protein [Anaerolineaceae bacterium]
MGNHVIETHDLTVYYGKHRGIEKVNLTVEQGEVFGFLGPNGAGKTTTQRVLMDVIHPSAGQATIFGMDCQKEGVPIRKRLSYLPGELNLYPNMRADAFLDMLASLQDGRQDTRFRDELCQRLDFDPTRRMKEYSRGNKQKVGIVAAFMDKPDLLILDEPTSGLDPLVQQTVMELVREVKADGRTVFFSSHILPEVQAVCDRVGIIREGQLIQTASVESLTKQAFKRVHLTFRNLPPAGAFTMDGVTETGRDGQTVMLEVRSGLPKLMELAAAYQIEDVEAPHVTLEEIFLNFYDRTSNGGQ